MIPIFTRKNPNQGNPGDSFICWGLQHLIQNLYPKSGFLLLDKFNETEFKSKLELIKKIGYMFYAGMPQYNNLNDWQFWFDTTLWSDYLIPNNISVYNFAGGAGFPDLNISPEELANYCLNDQNTKNNLLSRIPISKITTVRDHYAFEITKNVGLNPILLTCPSIFSTKYRNITKKTIKNRIAIVPPEINNIHPRIVNANDESERNNIISNKINDLYNKLKLDHEVIIVNHSINDLQNENSFYTDDSHQLLSLYSTCEYVISARLHAALPSWGLGVKTISLNVDTRGSATKLAPEIINLNLNTPNEQIINELKNTNESSQLILNNIKDQYLNIIQQLYIQ